MARSELRLGPTPARRRKEKERKPFFSPAMRKAVADRGYALSGTAFGLIALVMIAALLSYDSSDPSLNTAVPEGVTRVRNLLGTPGAWFADFLFQAFGWAGWLAPAMVMVWGWLLAARRPPRRPPIRFLLFVSGALFASAALGSTSTADVLGVQPGGGFGILARSLSTPLAAEIGGSKAISDVLGAISAGLLFLATGVSLRDWVGVLWMTTRAILGFPLASLRRLVPGANAVREDVGASGLDPAPEAAPRRREPALKRRDPIPPGPPDPPQVQPAVEPARAPPPPSRAVEPAEPSFELPPLELLRAPDPTSRGDRPSSETLARSSATLLRVLDDFGVKGEIRKVNPGPVVTLYELEPAPGTKSSRVIGLADDIARSMSAVSSRVAVVPGRNVIGIELPNPKREIVMLRELLASDAFVQHQGKLPLALGKDIGGQPVVADLSRFPHLLVAGTTGSGKSVAINTMILSLLRRLPPDRCRLIMIDPKMLELSVYEGIPHLLAPVVTDPKKAVVALKWTVREMEERYRAMSKLGVRNIDGFNARLREARENGESLTRRVQTGFDPDTGKPLFEEQPLDLSDLPHIVVVVDEMADLMLVAGKDIEAAVQRLAQMARAAGIHIIMATQRPSVDVITGTIKANFPTRVSFQVTSRIDSRTVLGEHGAEQLLGQGDMLFMAGGGRITRVHGPFVSDHEVEEVVKFLKARGEPAYVEAVTEDDDEPSGGGDASTPGGSRGSGDDELYDRAVAIVCRERKASTSFVQRQLRIGYNSAARLIERMEAEGVVSKPNHSGKREVLARDIDDTD